MLLVCGPDSVAAGKEVQRNSMVMKSAKLHCTVSPTLSQ